LPGSPDELVERKPAEVFRRDGDGVGGPVPGLAGNVLELQVSFAGQRKRGGHAGACRPAFGPPQIETHVAGYAVVNEIDDMKLQ
jgi:hypothetical protein